MTPSLLEYEWLLPYTNPSATEGLRFSGGSEPRIHQLELTQLGDAYYSFEATNGDNLSIDTFLPASGPNEFANNLDIQIELIDPSGTPVAISPLGSINHTALATGVYTVRVSSENNTSGEFVLNVTGNTGGPADFVVASTDPATGSICWRFAN